DGAPVTPPMLKGGDGNAEALKTLELRRIVVLVDLEREVMERCPFDSHRFSRSIEWHWQGLTKETHDLRVAAIPVGHLQECNAFEFLENLESDDLGIESPDGFEISDSEDGLSDPSNPWIHDRRSELSHGASRREPGEMTNSMERHDASGVA